MGPQNGGRCRWSIFGGGRLLRFDSSTDTLVDKTKISTLKVGSNEQNAWVNVMWQHGLC